MMNKRVCAMLLTGAMLTASMAGAVQAEEFIADDVVVTEMDAFGDGSGVSALAADESSFGGKNYLKDGHKGYADNSKITQSLDWFEEAAENQYITFDKDDPDADYAFWHFSETTGTATKAVVYFEVPGESEPREIILNMLKDNGNQKHYAYITPSDWKLVDGWCEATEKGNFNLSHAKRHEAQVKVKATASVEAYHENNTIGKYMERNTIDTYERNTIETYEQYVTKHYVRPITQIMQRYAQKYLVPVFEKKMAGAYDDTLVTSLEGNNGGTLKNGHTYVAVNLDDVKTEEGKNYTIAYSNKKNTPIEYTYNVKVEGNKLIVSCGEDLAYASVGAYVWNTVPSKTNAPKHYNNRVIVDLPENCGDSIYLYTHFEKLGWYETDENGDYVYQFKMWQYDDSLTTYDEDFSLIDTIEGNYVFVNETYSGYECVKTDYTEFVKTDTTYSDPVHIEEKDEVIKSERINEPEYDSTGWKLKVYSKDDNENTIREQSLNTEFRLPTGEYTFNLYDDNNRLVCSKEVTVVKNDNTVTEVDFGTVEYHHIGNDTVNYTENLHTLPAKEETNIYTTHEAKEETNIYNDILAAPDYADAEATQQYNEEYLYKEDIKLGDEINADSEYAVKLN